MSFFFHLLDDLLWILLNLNPRDCQPGKKAKDDQVARTDETAACTDCDAGRYRQSTKDDEWTFTISPQDITASAGVTVTQTVSGVLVTGTLKTALTGADTKSIVSTIALNLYQSITNHN